MKRLSTIFLMLVVFASACSNDQTDKTVLPPEVTPEPEEALTFTATVDTELQTRVAGGRWEPDDVIGVIAYNSGGLISNASANNIRFVDMDGTGVFTVEDEDEQIILPSYKNPIDIVAYYPYNEGLDRFRVHYDLKDQDNLPELLFSNNATKVYKKGKVQPKLEFKWVLSRVRVNLTADEGIDLSEAQVRIGHMWDSGDFMFGSGKFDNTYASRSGLQFEMEPEADGEIYAGSLLVFPVEEITAETITVRFPDETFYSVDITSPIEAGKIHVYDIHLAAQ